MQLTWSSYQFHLFLLLCLWCVCVCVCAAFGRAVHCLAKIGEELYLEGLSAGVSLSLGGGGGGGGVPGGAGL